MKIKWGKLLIFLAIPLAVGGLSAWLTMGSMEIFAAADQPPLSPPGWLFPIVWSILFALMGYASYRVYMSDAPQGQKNRFWFLYGTQLVFNFFWSLIFFNLQAYFFAFFWLLVLWALILLMLITVHPIDKVAFWCLVPYLLWVTFAAYLNLGIALLN